MHPSQVRRARMRAMLPRERWSQAQSRALPRFRSEPAHDNRNADLLGKVELWTGQISAACRLEKTVSGLALLLFGKSHTVPTSGLRPHEGRFHRNAFRNTY